MTASMAGKWDGHYAGVTEPQAYGDRTTYAHIADWVAGCNPIEDWGCGLAWLKTLVDPDAYVGVDGSQSPLADKIVDLADYRSNCEAVVLRHVLEHNYQWEKILDNAVASFTKRLIVVLYTPVNEIETHVLTVEEEYGGVPQISFRLSDLVDRVPEAVSVETVPTVGHYGVETVLRVVR